MTGLRSKALEQGRESRVISDRLQMSGQNAKEKIYGLGSRFDTDGQLRSWAVSIRRQGRTFQRTFSVARYGSPEQAKAAALAYRDEVLRMFPPMSRREFGTIVRSNNTSGVPGVSRRIKDGVAYWSAMVYHAGGRTKVRSFSVKEWGEDIAKAKAIATRLSMLRDVPGWITHQPDTAVAGLVPPPLVVCSRAPVETNGSRRRDPSPERRVYRQPLRWKTKDGWKTGATWIAEYTAEDGCVKRRSFSVRKHGEEGARNLAQAQRKAWVDNLQTCSPRSAMRPSPDALVQASRPA